MTPKPLNTHPGFLGGGVIGVKFTRERPQYLRPRSVGGLEPKVADFWLTRILIPKKGDTSRDPKTRVRYKHDKKRKLIRLKRRNFHDFTRILLRKVGVPTYL